MWSVSGSEPARGPGGRRAAVGTPGGGAGRAASSEAGFGLVEVLVALTILAVGLLAVAGLTWGVARQTREAAVRTEQTLAARQVLEAMIDRGYAALDPGTTDTTLVVGERSYTVSRVVTLEGADLKRLAAVVPPTAGVGGHTFATLLNRDRSLP